MTQPTTVFLKPLQLIFAAMLGAQVFFALLLNFLAKPPTEPIESDIFIQIIPVLVVVTAILGYYLFNVRLNAVKEASNLETKKENYRAASVLKWACFEGGTLLALVMYLSFNIPLFYYVGLVGIAHFALHFPSRQRVMRELETDIVN